MVNETRFRILRILNYELDKRDNTTFLAIKIIKYMGAVKADLVSFCFVKLFSIGFIYLM